MTFPPGLRKLMLMAHIVSSVGFLGAVTSFLALAIAGRAGSEPMTLQAIYLTLDMITWWVIVPFCCASLATGILSALGTRWGLFRHYWVLVKLLLTIVITVFLALHTRPIGLMARMAADGSIFSEGLEAQRLQLVIASAAAVAALLAAAALSTFKPQGLTRYGWHKSRRLVTALPGAAAGHSRSPIPN